MKRYKFLREGLKSDSGNVVWKIGEWKKHTGDLEMCKTGFHCSKGMYQAFSYVPGEILAEVEVKGKSEKQNDKEVWSEMKVVKAYKWQKKDSVALAIYAAELVLPNYEKQYEDKAPRLAIEAAKKVLFNDTKKNRDAARSAAWSAARSAESAWSARSAAWSAAESAESAWSARSAAWSAARSAAWSAAESAAESAGSAGSGLLKKIESWFIDHLKELEEIRNET